MILEDFFEMIKTTVIVGYGMTETSPVITNRYTSTPTCLLKEGERLDIERGLVVLLWQACGE